MYVCMYVCLFISVSVGFVQSRTHTHTRAHTHKGTRSRVYVRAGGRAVWHGVGLEPKSPHRSQFPFGHQYIVIK